MERELIQRILILTLGYFAIGAAAILWITRRKDSEAKKQQWLKYFVYLFIVHFIIFLILLYPSTFLYFALLLVSLGLFELVKVSWNKHFSGRKLFLIAVYLLMSAGFVLFARQRREVILLIYLIVFVFDGFSQITGQLLGRRKLSPVISPNKTIEGFMGGITMATFTACAVSDMNFPKCFAIALLISVASLGGDLEASYFKRINDVKDYSNLIPGHGGVLDRFDSFIAAGSVYYFVFCLLHISF